MKIWHDDLGIQNDPHELRVLFRPYYGKPVFVRVGSGDTAVASLGPEHIGQVYRDWYMTIRLLLLAGF